MEIEFNNYFNRVLKDHLKYPETFVITFDVNKIILISNVNSRLLDTIKVNPTLKTNLLNSLMSVLNKYYSSNTVEDVYLSTHGHREININFKLKPPRFEVLFTELYSVIFSYSDSSDVQTFEGTKEFSHIVNDPKFWITLVNNKFPEYLILNEKINDYRDFYYNMFDLDNIRYKRYTYSNRIDLKILIESLTMKYPKIISHLIKNNQMYLDIEYTLGPTYILDDPELLKHVYSPIGYSISINTQYNNALYSPFLGPKIFDYLFIASGHSYNFKNLSSALIRLSSSPSDKDKKLVNYIISRIPENISKNELHQFLLYISDYGFNLINIGLLWNKYKHLFNPIEIKELNDRTFIHSYQTGDKSTLNFFGEPYTSYTK